MVSLVEICVTIRTSEEAWGLGNIGAVAIIGKLSPSEQKAFGEDENGRDMK